MMTTRPTALLAMILGLLLAGCPEGASGGKRVPVYTVTGKVTMGGGPLAGAIVSFAPTEGQPTAVGRSDDSGMYALTTYSSNDGAAKGAYKITVMKIVGAAPAATADAAHGSSYQGGAHDAKAAKGGADSGNLIPAQYGTAESTPLSFTVKEEPNTHDIDSK